MHMAVDCAYPNYGVAERILSLYTDAAKKASRDGLLPLHLAISTNIEPSVNFVAKLLAANPMAIHHEVCIRNKLFKQYL